MGRVPWDQDARSTFDLQIPKRLGTEDILQRDPFSAFLAEMLEPCRGRD
jgi:hypothetical protein